MLQCMEKQLEKLNGPFLFLIESILQLKLQVLSVQNKDLALRSDHTVHERLD